MKNTYPIKELANISFSYLNIPKGYHNRLVVPFVKKNCLTIVLLNTMKQNMLSIIN